MVRYIHTYIMSRRETRKYAGGYIDSRTLFFHSTTAFFDSFGDGEEVWTQPGANGTEANAYFFNEIVGWDTVREDSLRPTRLVGANVGYSALVWMCVWLCLAFGTEWTGRIAYITMGLPIIFLFIFLFRSVALEGASDGIEQYIGKWDLKILKEQPDVWSRAVSQIFFSLSTTMGTMPAYGSHCPRGEPAVVNSVVIGVSNCMFSFISGFAVFSGKHTTRDASATDASARSNQV